MSRPHVLIVEDDRDLADAYAEWLTDSFTASTAYDGRGALEVLDELDDEIDIVLLDRRLPDLSGDDVLEEIRDRDLGCRVAIVTAVDPDFDVIEMGFDDYLTKPISEDELHETVERLVAQSAYDEQVRDHLALVTKKTVLETEKTPRELEVSDEYARLERDIADSRDRLDATLSGDVFVEFLYRVVDDDLYTVLQYDPDSWEYRYVNDRVETFFARIDPDLDEMVDGFRGEGQRNTRLDSVFDLDGYYCSLHLFDWIVFMHFYQSDRCGIICGFDPDAASNLTAFVGRLLPYLREAGLDDIDRDPSWT